MKNTIFTYLIIIASLSQMLAQPINSVKYEDMLVAADLQMEKGDYFNALDWYRNAYRENKSDDVALSIAYSYYKMRDFVNAERYYSRVLDEDVDNVFIDDRYAYGRTLRSVEQPAKAMHQFNSLIENSADQELIALAKNEIAGMTSLENISINEEVVVKFGEGDINSGSGEYSPVLYDETTIYFSSFDRSKEIVIDGKEKKYHAKIFRATKSEKGYSKPEELDRKVNRDGFHVGNVAFSDDKRRMYYSRQMLENDKIISSTIYYSNMEDEDWGAAEPLPSVNGSWISKQPASGELLGTKVLFFVSDMEGGFGGDDIYYVTTSGEGLSAPVNLGPTINTPHDEITPHYHDGKLYFSTEGRPGIGGYDIFHSTWDGSDWSEPENMGLNYNTLFDDFYLFFDSKGTNGFLVSNRPDEKKKKLKSETCCYDIYDFNIRQLIIDLLVGVSTEDKKPLDGATVELADLTAMDDPLAKTLPDDYRFDFDLDAERKYSIITSKEGYSSDTLELNTYGIIEDKEIRKIVVLKQLAPPPPPEPTFRIDTVTINEAIRFDNIYYKFEKWDILPESEKDLTIILNLLNEYSDMVIELSSHTDARGTTIYNEDLSQKRAESARQWLLERGVSENRIVAKGYGESKILNRCVNGVRCPDTEHQFNRRTEFKIIAGPQTIEIRREVKTEYDGSKQSIRQFNIPHPSIFKDSFPIITFEEPVIDLGKIKQGDTRKIVFEFENTGDRDLHIDLATACKCTEIKWPEDAVPPGGHGKIVAVFDSRDMEGVYNKTIDIIANTNPIVVEAKFNVEIVLTD